MHNIIDHKDLPQTKPEDNRDRIQEQELEIKKLRRQTAIYEAFFNHSSDAIFIHDLDGQILEVNDEAVKRLGHPRQQLLRMNINDIDAPDLAVYNPIELNHPKTDEGSITETAQRIFSGEMGPVEINAGMVDLEGGKAVIAVSKDLRGIKRAEQALIRTQERYKLLFDGYGHPVMVYDRDCKVLTANVAAAEYIGLAPSHLVGRYLNEFAPEIFESFGERIKRVVDEGVELHVESQINIKGEKRWFRSIIQPLSHTQGERYAAQVIFYEITAKKRAEDALKDSKAQFKAVFENSSVGICVASDTGKIIMANSALSSMLRIEHKKLMGKNILDFFARDHKDRARQNLNLVGANRNIEPRIEARLSRLDQTNIWTDVSFSTVPGTEKGSVEALMFIIDITDRKKAETELRKSEQKHRTIIESIKEGYYEVDLKGSFIFLNQSMCDILGYSEDELIGHNYHSFLDAESARVLFDTFNSVYRSGVPIDLFEWDFTRRDGAMVNLESSISPITQVEAGIVGFSGICRDVTEKHEKRKIDLQAERMKAVGELASGVSHNFNNLLQIVLGSCQLGRVNLELGNYEESERHLRQIQQSAEVGAETVKRLQHFARIRSDKDSEESFDLSKTVTEAIEMSRVWWQSVPERDGIVINLSSSVAPDCFVLGKENEIFEVIVNLIKNAAEAITGDGDLTIRTEKKDDNIILEVTDNGIGMPQENVDKIFQPFFTTKGYQSSGMGLSSSHGIIQRHGGAIHVKSEPDKGTTFTVSLPKAEEQLWSEGQSIDRLPRKLDIIAVDDLEPLLRMLCLGLKEYGQTVRTAESGHKAIELFKQKIPDLVISDLGMPVMNGWAVCKTLKSICSERNVAKPPFIILTGWTEQEFDEKALKESGVDIILEKPIVIPKLVETIKKVVE